MTRATLADVLQPALAEGYAVAGLVVLGWEDARAYAQAAQSVGLPIILQAGPGCRKHTPLPVLAAMFHALADDVDVPVVAHLDHAYILDECQAAIDCGFTSVMFDGSRKPMSQNIDETARIVEIAHAAGVSVEGEIGFVGYAEGEASAGTNADEAQKFSIHSGVDAMAVSVGNVHLQQSKQADIDRSALAAIEAVTNVPLVIHGSSGIASETRTRLARTSKICKFNIGTELRMAFGEALRASIAANPDEFDRIALLKGVEQPLRESASEIIRSLGPS